MINDRVEVLSSLIDLNKWRGAIYGMFSYTLTERENNWTYEDDVDFEISCEIRTLLFR